jgi:hypothetical protein
MAEIIVSHGLCTPIRPKVLTALEPYAFKGLKVQAWGEGRFGTDDTTSKTKDTDKLARQHYARTRYRTTLPNGRNGCSGKAGSLP